MCQNRPSQRIASVKSSYENNHLCSIGRPVHRRIHFQRPTKQPGSWCPRGRPTCQHYRWFKHHTNKKNNWTLHPKKKRGYTPIKVPFTYSREYIPASHEDIATPDLARQWKHLSHIADKIPLRSDVDIGLLIGRNVPAAFQPINVISGNEEESWAEQYKFGWTVIGRVCKDKQPTSNPVSVNRVTVERETLLDCTEMSEASPFTTKNSMSSKDLTSPKQLCEMMELDYNEIHHSRRIPGTEQAESMEDRCFNDKGLHKNAEGNWEAPLPFKTDNVLLPDNKGHCLRRLLSLKRRLLNDKGLKDDYLAFMKRILDNGHASQVP